MSPFQIDGWVDPLFHPRLEIRLFGLDTPLQVFIDTGYASIFCVHQDDALRAGLILNQTRRQKVNFWEHPEGSLMLTQGRIYWFGQQIRIPILVADNRYRRLDMLPRLGTDILQDCELYIDFPSARVTIQKVIDQS